jgi:hypothetical protein
MRCSSASGTRRETARQHVSETYYPLIPSSHHNQAESILVKIFIGKFQNTIS